VKIAKNIWVKEIIFKPKNSEMCKKNNPIKKKKKKKKK